MGLVISILLGFCILCAILLVIICKATSLADQDLERMPHEESNVVSIDQTGGAL